jgi:excisionase family DNA binding protein
VSEPITTVEAARRLGVSRRRVLQLIKQGRIEARFFANAYMVDAESVAAFKRQPPGRPAGRGAREEPF